ncbi:hypothetical protein F5Y19DRAFT_413747, partial [Xylariaceae sp. FL1651]
MCRFGLLSWFASLPYSHGLRSFLLPVGTKHQLVKCFVQSQALSSVAIDHPKKALRSVCVAVLISKQTIGLFYNQMGAAPPTILIRFPQI